MKDELPPWLLVDPQGILLSVYIQPQAKKSEIWGEFDGKLKIRIAAPPVDGKANSCLVEFLAKQLGCSRSSIMIEAGEMSRLKKVRVLGVKDLGQLLSSLNPGSG
jgi:uncharacterized protein (TIGR00251 family)